MNIDFIEIQHRDNVLQLMEICSLDMNQAYNLYVNCGNNLEAAIQRKFNQNHGDFGGFEQKMESPKKNVPTHYNNHPQSRSNNIPGFGDHQDQYQKYRNFQNAGVTFPQRYQIKRTETGLKSWLPKFMKSTQQNSFKKSLETYIQKTTKLSFASGNLSQNFQDVWKNKFPLVVHLLNFNSKDQKIIKDIYTHDFIVDDILNTQFKNYGLDTNSYQLQKSLKNLIDYKKASCMLIFRISICDEIRLIDTIMFNEIKAPEEVIKRMKFIKSNCIQIQMEELQLEKRFHAELMGDFNYQKPMSIAEKKKIAEDRAIRKKQEEEFHASMKTQQVKKKAQAQKKKQIQMQEAMKPKFNAKKHRQQIKSKLQIYSEGMMIKLRLPSGQSIVVTVSPQQKVQYLFDFVQIQQKDMGFQNDDLRKMQIKRPFDRLNLSQHRDKTLKQIFEGSDSQSLVVAEVQ